MDRTGQGNLYSHVSHRLSSDGTSIFKRLASHSLTGRGLGIDVHGHLPMQLRLYWSTDSYTNCYSRCLVRSHLEYGENALLLDGLVNGGLVAACKCLSSWLPVDEDTPLRSFIFSAQLPAERHAFNPSFTPYPHLIESTCHCCCSDILISDQDTTTSLIWYLFNRNWVDTRWQHHTTHLQQTIHTIHREYNSGSAGRAQSLPVIPWHLPYSWGKNTEKTSVRVAQYKNNEEA